MEQDLCWRSASRGDELVERCRDEGGPYPTPPEASTHRELRDERTRRRARKEAVADASRLRLCHEQPVCALEHKRLEPGGA
eukprot:scaffold160294_cov37-Tisochrysis_lutea.AAC.1